MEDQPDIPLKIQGRSGNGRYGQRQRLGLVAADCFEDSLTACLLLVEDDGDGDMTICGCAIKTDEGRGNDHGTLAVEREGGGRQVNVGPG